jgi:thiamine biosynthesis lipoprotein
MHSSVRGLVAAACLCGLLAGCGKPKPVTATFAAGSYTGTVSVAAADKRQIADVTEIVRSMIDRTVRAMDARDENSMIGKLNRVANLVQVPLSEDTFRVIDLAYYYAELTGGAYDITAAPLYSLWGIDAPTPPDDPPTAELISATRASMGKVNAPVSNNRTIAFTTPLTRIDPRELAIGYATDLAILQLRRNRIANGLVIFHQTARCQGTAGKLQAWEVSVPHPTQPGVTLGRLTLPEGYAVHTTRLFERTVRIREKTYGHVIDPRSGLPVEDTLSATVLGPTATQASALAEALVVLGLDEATTILPRFERHDVLMVPNREPLELWITPGFAVRFKPEPAYSNAVRFIETAAGDGGP